MQNTCSHFHHTQREVDTSANHTFSHKNILISSVSMMGNLAVISMMMLAVANGIILV